jgi:hypothetical protein
MPEQQWQVLVKDGKTKKKKIHYLYDKGCIYRGIAKQTPLT